jgi:hypothetical protein
MAAMQLNQTWFQPKGRPSAQEHRLRLKRPTPCVYAPVPLYIKLNPRPLLALATSAFFRGSLRFFSSKPNFKIFPKLLPKPRRASPSPESWQDPRSLIRLHERRLEPVCQFAIQGRRVDEAVRRWSTR